MYLTDPHQEEDHIATGSESLREFAFNAGMDHPERCWLLDSRDVWVRNPFYSGPEEPHPEDEPRTEEELRIANEEHAKQFTEWRGDSDGTVGVD